MKTTRSDLDILADRLRKCYQFERNQLALRYCRPDGYCVPTCWRVGGPEGKGQSPFHKLARFCQRQEIDPFHYIKWCFRDPNLFVRPTPEPNQLLSAKKMEDYKGNQVKVREAIELKLKIEKRNAQTNYSYQKSCLKANDAWASVLLDGKNALSPLVRYAYAHILVSRYKRFLKIAEIWEEGAMVQYQVNPDVYGANWIGKVLPLDFAERAAHFYEQLLDQEP